MPPLKKLLLDTIAVWGLIFVNSKYHEPVMKLIKGNDIMIHVISFHELAYPAYKLESRGGLDIEMGLELFKNLKRGYDNLYNNYQILGINKLTIIPLNIRDLIDAYNLLLEEKEIFIEKRDGFWPSIADAIIATTWKKLNITLITKDEKLIKYGEKHKLKYTKI